MEMIDVNWKGIVQETLMITSFVIIMMLLIEFINVLSRGKLMKLLSKNIYIQVITGTLLGLIPGCLGTFTAVSLYTHRLLTFGALVATMIATSGDEAYFMLALIPKQAMLIFGILAVVAVVTGIIVDKLSKNKHSFAPPNFAFEIHEENCSDKNECLFAFKNISLLPKRLLLVAIIISIMLLSFFGWIGHSHSDELMFSLPKKNSNELVEISDIKTEHEQHDCEHNHDETHEHQADCEHAEENSDIDAAEHSHEHGFDWVKITIMLSSLFALIVVLFSSEHFLTHHLWDHVIKKHLPKIFLWVLGTMILINIILNYSDFGNWIYDNMFFILIVAVLLGLIPQSGPHLVFVVLFIQGILPFSILMASSIVQDGHGSLPLLAESKKSFVYMKIINILVGLFVGAIGLLLNF